MSSEHGWEEMRWDRLEQPADDWSMDVIDTSRLSREDVADAALRWCRRALAGDVPTLHVPSA
jgi:hypothetical protein